ncbi:MAG: hypothetical protein KKD77_23750, partial [Gammaproteobacteria bacterium]|nr:hypothetical protein [Gammaproteobacteria bacterium]
SCLICKKPLSDHRAMYCLRHRPITEETKIKIGLANSISQIGKKHSEETRKKMKEAHIGFNAGEKHYRWNPDREAVRRDLRNDPVYKQWSREVKMRDGWKCKINNQDCKGKVIAHHILPWRDFPELRYQVNNGITLCLAHHPKKRAEEKRLIPTFMELVPVLNLSTCQS